MKGLALAATISLILGVASLYAGISDGTADGVWVGVILLLIGLLLAGAASQGHEQQRLASSAAGARGGEPH